MVMLHKLRQEMHRSLVKTQKEVTFLGVPSPNAIRQVSSALSLRISMRPRADSSAADRRMMCSHQKHPTHKATF